VFGFRHAPLQVHLQPVSHPAPEHGHRPDLSEWHTGYRAYSRAVLDIIPYQRNDDGFLFDGQFLIQAAYFQLKMGDLPVPCRYMREASSVGFAKSVGYGLGILKTLLQYLVQKSGIASFAIFRSGADRVRK